jgi:hypothetical protein
MYYGLIGIKNKDFIKVFIAVVCLTALWFALNFRNARVIWYIFPFIYLIILSLKRLKWVGYIFVLVVFLQSFQQFVIGYSRNPESNLWLYIYEQKIVLPDKPLLSSFRRRHPYFFLGVRNYLGNENANEIRSQIQAPGKFMPKLNLDLINHYGSLFVLGDSTYIDSTFLQVEKMDSLNEFNVIQKPLTPNLDEFDGWSLVELSVRGIH